MAWKVENEWNKKAETINSTVLEQKAIKRVIKNNNLHYLKAKALSDLCVKPLPNEQYRIVTEKQFNAYALILYLLQTEIIEELNIAIYRINEPTVVSIIELIEQGKIKRANFVISNFFNQTKKPEKWAILLRDYCSKSDKCTHRYTHNHAKVVTIKTNSGYYVFEGSGNMSDNARIEQYVFENNKDVFDFHTNWIKGLIDGVR